MLISRIYRLRNVAMCSINLEIPLDALESKLRNAGVEPTVKNINVFMNGLRKYLYKLDLVVFDKHVDNDFILKVFSETS